VVLEANKRWVLLGFLSYEILAFKGGKSSQIVQFEGWMNCWKLEKIDLGITPSFAKCYT
jgi:hypothetical protein